LINNSVLSNETAEQRHKNYLREIFAHARAGPVASARILIPRAGLVSCSDEAVPDKILFKDSPPEDLSTFQFLQNARGTVSISIGGRYVSAPASDSRCSLVSDLSDATSFILDWETGEGVGDVVIRPAQGSLLLDSLLREGFSRPPDLCLSALRFRTWLVRTISAAAPPLLDDLTSSRIYLTLCPFICLRSDRPPQSVI
jgi:hypothetical protein